MRATKERAMGRGPEKGEVRVLLYSIDVSADSLAVRLAFRRPGERAVTVLRQYVDLADGDDMVARLADTITDLRRVIAWSAMPMPIDVGPAVG